MAENRGAGATAPGQRSAVVVVEPPWDWARRTLNRARRARLCAREGVIGCGLGPRLRHGRVEREPCATVYVARKRPPGELPRGARLPRRLATQSRALEVDVVELGDLEPHAVCGPQLPREAPRAGLPPHEPVGRRAPTFPADEGQPVRLLGRVSGSHTGVLCRAYVFLPGWGLERALLADVHSLPGDSGSPLVDAEGRLLGLLVGRATGGDGRLRVFRVVESAECEGADAPL